MAHLEDVGTGRPIQSGITPERSLTATGKRISRHIGFAAAIFWMAALVAWELAARADMISPLFFPAPSAILATFWRMLIRGELVVATGYTLARLSAGLLLGGALGLVLGLLMGWSSAARALAEPVVAAVHPLPKLALLPLVLILFGIGEQSKVVLIALTAFFPLLINTTAGVRQIDAHTWEVARHYGARGWMLLRRVVWPASLPLVLTGAQLSLNAALVVTVAVELLSAQQGLGATIWLAWQTLRTEEMYATLIVIALVGMLSNLVLVRLEHRLIPRKRKDESDGRA
ncbi:MAG: ABC transporter permease [Anaerolineales bacterium]|nr:ABC transporter permease [Anaerolineales bacterium]